MLAGLVGALLTAGCGAPAPTVGTSTTMNLTTPSALSAPSAAAPTPVPTQRNWFDLQVGDCLGEIPQVDLGEVTAPLVDCASPHQAEVFLRAPVEVDAAIADVADQRCGAGVVDYTGRPTKDAFVVTYLIDSNQDRTVAHPLPSTVICLLQSANGQPSAGSARR